MPPILPALALLVIPPCTVAMTPRPLPELRAAVIVPGFLNDKNDFMPLARTLSARGIRTAVVPMPIWHWLPVIGGRSVRPVLDRIGKSTASTPTAHSTR